MRKATGSYHTYPIPGKTAALFPEFAVDDLPSAELQPRFLRLVVVVDLGFTTLLTSQVISGAFYSERERSDRFCSEALISA